MTLPSTVSLPSLLPMQSGVVVYTNLTPDSKTVLSFVKKLQWHYPLRTVRTCIHTQRL